MEALELGLLLLAAVLLSSVIDQLVPKVSSPLIQIALGVAIALLASGQVNITLDPELFLVLFIAPLLYDEAHNANRAALWSNLKTVVSLAVGLVVVTVLIVGFTVNWLVPSIPLAAAFALGAALGPTDAVAVAALPKEANVSERQRNILKGESLINDASGIVTFQFAIAAVTTGTFSLLSATVDFGIHFFGGLIAGVLMGKIGDFIVRRVRSFGLENTTFHVLFEVFTPFIVYLIAEHLHTSGIIAVVAAALTSAASPRAVGPAISRMNIVSTSVWRVLTFALNGIVFVMLGTQLPKAMQSTWDDVTINNVDLVFYILIISFVLQFVRFLWLLVIEVIRYRKDPDRGRFGWPQVRSALIMSLAGAKGTITLAIAFTIPFMSSPGVAFPQRNLLIFLASGVILVTLLLSTFVVPLLTPKSPKAENEPKEEDNADEECTIEILRLVIEELTARQTPQNRRATQSVIHSYNDRIARIKDHHNVESEPNIELRLMALGWEKDYVLKLIESGETSTLVGYHYLSRLAHIENLLKHHTTRWSLLNTWRRVRASLTTAVRNFVKHVPGITIAERDSATRDLQIRSSTYVIERLRDEIASLEAPAEDVCALQMEYQRTLAALRNTLPSVTAITRTSEAADNVQRTALNLEMEFIQNMYEDGRLTRAASKRLRDNVTLMKVDLEDNV